MELSTATSTGCVDMLVRRRATALDRCVPAMRRTLPILCVALTLLGCARQPSSRSAALRVGPALDPDFPAEFARLFLSREPLRYQDNVALLDSIPVAGLSPAETDLVRAKLRQFLSARIEDRPYASDSHHTGVASEIAFLRLQAVQVLAEIGTQKDIEFIQTLDKYPDGEHPLFDEQCRKAIEKLANR